MAQTFGTTVASYREVHAIDLAIRETRLGEQGEGMRRSYKELTDLLQGHGGTPSGLTGFHR